MAAPTNDKEILVALVMDFETGGLKCQTSACTQISIQAVRLDTFEVLDKLVRYIKPYRRQDDKTGKKRKVLKNKFEQEEAPMMDYEDKALEYSHIEMDTLLEEGVELAVVAQDIIDFIKKNTLSKKKNMKPFFIGQHIQFDLGFLTQIMEYTGLIKEFSKIVNGDEDFYGHFQAQYIDTIQLGQLALCHLPNVNSYKLEIMAERLGIELDDAHDADADVTATLNVALVLAGRMRNTNGSGDGGLQMATTEKSRVHFKI